MPGRVHGCAHKSGVEDLIEFRETSSKLVWQATGHGDASLLGRMSAAVCLGNQGYEPDCEDVCGGLLERSGACCWRHQNHYGKSTLGLECAPGALPGRVHGCAYKSGVEYFNEFRETSFKLVSHAGQTLGAWIVARGLPRESPRMCVLNQAYHSTVEFHEASSKLVGQANSHGDVSLLGRMSAAVCLGSEGYEPDYEDVCSGLLERSVACA